MSLDSLTIDAAQAMFQKAIVTVRRDTWEWARSNNESRYTIRVSDAQQVLLMKQNKDGSGYTIRLPTYGVLSEAESGSLDVATLGEHGKTIDIKKEPNEPVRYVSDFTLGIVPCLEVGPTLL
jgi:hypothetical protein